MVIGAAVGASLGACCLLVCCAAAWRVHAARQNGATGKPNSSSPSLLPSVLSPSAGGGGVGGAPASPRPCVTRGAWVAAESPAKTQRKEGVTRVAFNI